AALPSTSLQVELALAAAAQRLPMSARLELALNISTDRRNAQDANLPLLIWYAVEPVPDYKWSWTEELLMSDIPLLSQYVARRTAELDDRRRGQLGYFLYQSADDPKKREKVRELVRGMEAGLQSRAGARNNRNWMMLFLKLSRVPDNEIQARTRRIAVRFGDQAAISALQKEIVDVAKLPGIRRAALQTLVEGGAPNLMATLRELIADRDMRGAA